MSKERFEWHSYYTTRVIDNKTNRIVPIITTLNQQDQRIAELEEQLKNAIVPKFKVNDKIFVIVNDKIEEYHIDEVLLKCKGTLVAYRDICEETTITEKNEIFSTLEEAQAKLKELGENK